MEDAHHQTIATENYQLSFLINLDYEFKMHIVGFLIEESESIQAASKNIRALICAHSTFDKLLNDESNSAYILKSLGACFDLVNRRFIAQTLGTRYAKQWLRTIHR